MKEEKLSGALQENILTLLIFSDNYCKLIRHSVTPSLFESAVFREIASAAIDFIDQFGEAIKEHLPDSLEGILQGSDKRKATSYSRVLDNLFLSRESINGEYVISQLHRFIRQQKLKSAVVAAVEAMEDGRIDQAEVELQKGLASQAVAFEPGTIFSNPKESLSFFEHEKDSINIGIEVLDRRGINLRPQELMLYIASAKKGKSWFLTHVGKWALIQKKQVLHVTLEMSERRVSQRYVQSFFSISKSQSEVKTTTFHRDERGSMVDIDFDTVTRPTLLDPKIKKTLSDRINKEFKNRVPLIIKQFPTGSLTIAMLNAYLDGLERFHKFVPDVLLVDYPRLMRLDAANLRIDLGQVVTELRGIAVERNMAVVAPAQGNRDSAKARVVDDSMVGEDWSLIATADTVITYTQTMQEKALNLARLFVSNGRNDEDKFMALITQAYHMGQFCLDSTLMNSSYQDIINEHTPGKRKRDAEDD